MLKDLKILYAEDDEGSRENLKDILELFCNNIFVAQDGKEALELYYKVHPDIVILDIEMPFVSGINVASKIRENDNKTQIIITTAYTDTKYFLKAIELNLIKYLVKPIKFPDVKACLDQAVKNVKVVEKVIYLLNDGYSYNFDTRALRNEANKIVHLSNNEMLLLELLIKNNNHIVSYVQIENFLYDYGYSDTSSYALRSLVRNLRHKLPEDTILNISKQGYKVELND